MMHEWRRFVAVTRIMMRLARERARAYGVRRRGLAPRRHRHGIRAWIVRVNVPGLAVIVVMMAMCKCVGTCADETAPIPAAELLRHFPDRAHAVVWRNWQAVEPERIATLLGTSLESIHDMANSTGLPTPSLEEALDAVAEQRLGRAAAPHARQAWTVFSRAFEQYPYSGSVLYFNPLQLGPANLLDGRRTSWRTTMVGFPYDHLERWCPPYPPEVFASQLDSMQGSPIS